MTINNDDAFEEAVAVANKSINNAMMAHTASIKNFTLDEAQEIFESDNYQQFDDPDHAFNVVYITLDAMIKGQKEVYDVIDIDELPSDYDLTPTEDTPPLTLSAVLDGSDMKAIIVENGSVSRMQYMGAGANADDDKINVGDSDE